MSIIDYRQKVIDALKAQFGPDNTLRDVRSHPGKLTIDDIDRLVTLAPAAFVALMGARPSKDSNLGTGQVLVTVDVAVFVATKNGVGPDQSADTQGWRIAQNIGAMALWNNFGSPQFPPTQIEIENLWSINEDKKGVCIMGVAWQTQVLVGVDLTASQATGSPSFPTITSNGTVQGDTDPLGPVTAQP